MCLRACRLGGCGRVVWRWKTWRRRSRLYQEVVRVGDVIRRAAYPVPSARSRVKREVYESLSFTLTAARIVSRAVL